MAAKLCKSCYYKTICDKRTSRMFGESKKVEKCEDYIEDASTSRANKKMGVQNGNENLDKILIAHGTYANWQKKAYPVKVSFPQGTTKVRTFDHDFDFSQTRIAGFRYRKVDTDYNRNPGYGV